MADSSPLAHSPTLSAGPPHGEEQRLGAGTRIGEYTIERFIGAGAMGEVYAGRHPVIGKRVALKVLRHELASSAEAAERFIREARAVNQIEHENVIDVFAFGRLDDGRLYLVMDLVEGKSLRAHLVDGPLDLAAALDILDVIAAALDAAHAKGVVHRDLKPDNIVLSNATPPKIFVLDFGIAKLVSNASEGGSAGPGTLTGQGTWLGTPSYMAPEQWSADGAGPASDRYALGVIAFELLAGAPPFSASSAPGMMEQHFRAKVPALASRGASVPAAIDDVLERALAKEPDARYPTAGAFSVALRAAAGSGAQRARPTTASKKPWVPAVAGAGVLGFAVVAVIASRGGHDKPTPPDESPPGTIPVEIRSEPAGAQIKVDGKPQGETPVRVSLATDVAVAVVVSKPGYLADRRTIRPHGGATVETFSLGEVTRFQGVWRIASGERAGELRKLERDGDHVSIYKLREVTGTPEFFKHYKFTAADTGIAFAADDEVVDPRKPNDPRCHVPVRVEYRYDTESDQLEQRADKITFDQHGGDCVVRSRDVVVAQLARVDAVSDTLEVSAPAGTLDNLPVTKDGNTKPPPAKVTPKKKAVVPLDPKADLQKKAAKTTKRPAEAQQDLGPPTKTDKAALPEPVKSSQAPAPQAPVKPTSAKSAAKNAPPQQAYSGAQSQILPQPQAAPPIQTQELPPQQRQKN
ncbi:MAG: protein kinase [Kofleriaceae bacterium]|nr:protein kinase [Kofleriaceae bacterium]